MKFGVDLGRCNPRVWVDVARAAEAAGYESVWIPEHLVFPASISGSPSDALAHGAVDPATPTFDPFVVLATLGAVAPNLRLGTHVYNIGLRHPFVTARAVATLDVLTGGRVILGIGASWLREEWDAVGLDFATRGRRVDEALAVCRRLWTEREVAHDGEFFRFAPVLFEPKPVQQPVPVHVGGDSAAALRRAARAGDGWIGMIHTVESFAVATTGLRDECEAQGRARDAVECTALVARPDRAGAEAWARAGADRLILAPWARSAEAVDALGAFADEHGLTPRTAPQGR